MIKIVTIISMVGLASVSHADEESLTREQLFAPITDPSVNPNRLYAEFDLNGDGINDLILSETMSLGGTGGFVYNLYLGTGGNRFRRIDRFVAKNMALEMHSEKPMRLWFFSGMSASSGKIEFRYFDQKGVFQKSQMLIIQPGDGGTEIGNDIFNSIFNENTMLKIEKI